MQLTTFVFQRLHARGPACANTICLSGEYNFRGTAFEGKKADFIDFYCNIIKYQRWFDISPVACGILKSQIECFLEK